MFDKQANVPINLKGVIGAELNRLLPAGRGVWKGGGFAITSLHYTSRVWNDGDVNCCLSDGRVDIQFAIRENSLVVLDARYSPSDEVVTVQKKL